MSLTIYEVLCNARYNLENAVFPFQIEMAKEQLANALDAIDNGKTLNDVWEEAQPNAAVPYKPTFTPQNEPLTCEGCMYIDEYFGPCAIVCEPGVMSIATAACRKERPNEYALCSLRQLPEIPAETIHASHIHCTYQQYAT